MTTTPIILGPKEKPRANGHPAAPPPLPADAATAAPAGLPDLTALSDEALADLRERAQEEAAQRQARRESEFLAMVAATAKTLGVSPARIAAAIANKAHRPRAAAGGDGRSNVRPKFWCPSDHSLRWSGRGGAPKWFADHLSAGGKEEEMRIPEGAQ